jgi:hypothetical protein
MCYETRNLFACGCEERRDDCLTGLRRCAWAEAKGADCPDFQISTCEATSVDVNLAYAECASTFGMSLGRFGRRDVNVLSYLKGSTKVLWQH